MADRSRYIARVQFLGAQRIEIGNEVVTPDAERLFAMIVRLSVPLGRISMIDSRGWPTTAGFMIFFGLMFLVRRWWWQADSFRKSRFRISTAIVTLVLGMILSQMLPFPEILGATWALAISSVIQLSSGWTPPGDRLLSPAPELSQVAPMVAQVRHPIVANPAVNKV